MEWAWFLLVGVLSGWLAGRLTQARNAGVFADLVVGVLGAALGGFVFHLLGLTALGHLGALLTAAVGAIVLLSLSRMLTGA
jgi:uncharacterized membrane protein YeaQ/YmgE (transglycosylase-associated protein family)